MKFHSLIMSVALVGCLCAGCVSSDPQKFSSEVRKWVPIGTPLAKAQSTMEHHDFDCELLTKDHPFNQYGIDYLDCDRVRIGFHDWKVKLFIRDGKVSSYGYIGVDHDTY